MKKRQLKKLIRKALYSEVGFSGKGPSLLDKAGIKRYGRLHPRHRGVLKSLIEAEKTFRWASFRQAIIDVTGEDPDTDWVS